jgi:hypothetical protein
MLITNEKNLKIAFLHSQYVKDNTNANKNNKWFLIVETALSMS